MRRRRGRLASPSTSSSSDRLDDEELHSLYEEIDLFVHPTLYEGSSLVALEVVIHRKPVVASAAGGIPDKVFDGRNGYFDAPRRRRRLGGQDRARARRAPCAGRPGEESVRIVRTTFDWPVVARRN